jgi:hypothetical protein
VLVIHSRNNVSCQHRVLHAQSVNEFGIFGLLCRVQDGTVHLVVGRQQDRQEILLLTVFAGRAARNDAQDAAHGKASMLAVY